MKFKLRKIHLNILVGDKLHLLPFIENLKFKNITNINPFVSELVRSITDMLEAPTVRIRPQKCKERLQELYIQYHGKYLLISKVYHTYLVA